MTCDCKNDYQCCYDQCGCAKPVFDIEPMPGNVAMLKYNYGGVSTWYDYTNMIEQTQTDTNIRTDAKKRLLIHNAERHTDTVPAKQIGEILHIADIGDVDISGVQDNSLFVYQKNSDCVQGCVGIDNSWIAWNALDHQDSSLQTVMGFDADGKPHALAAPSNTNQFYQLGWNGANKVSWKQPTQFNDTNNKVALYMDKDTKEIGWVQS